ncbi:DNA polymerase III chi subunit [hydrothermal vent metagenome]|uniref:DNA polymerase III chi subunit n=1 Tax=hydrothermal vent metagenome TaxID=652676 RepID=A0A3B0RZY0_9ZZZZ
MELWFYHLERAPLDQVLPDLLEKTLANNWRALVCSPDQQRLDWLDDLLWAQRDDSFLPHGQASTPRADKQPILLTMGKDNENNSNVAFLLDGVDPADFQDFERTIIMFDGADEQGLQNARNYWKVAKTKKQVVRYWKQSESGKWENLA